jgi:hypothetical protein
MFDLHLPKKKPENAQFTFFVVAGSRFEPPHTIKILKNKTLPREFSLVRDVRAELDDARDLIDLRLKNEQNGLYPDN